MGCLLGLQRLAGRDDAGHHRAIYVKLHLLQGALALFSGERSDAASLLRKADVLRKELTLEGSEDDAKVASLVALGVSQHAARAALLACAKDLERAAAYALERVAAERKRKERKRKERAWLERFGRTAQHGVPIDGDTLATLVGFGYPELIAVEALRRHENALEAAVATLCDSAEQEALQLAALQRMGVGAAAAPAQAAPAPVACEPEEAKVLSLVDMGFEFEAARRVLIVTGNNVTEAALKLSRGEDAAAEMAPPPPPPPPAPLLPPLPPQTEAHEKAEHELADAVHQAERAYLEAADLREEGAVLAMLQARL